MLNINQPYVRTGFFPQHVVKNESRSHDGYYKAVLSTIIIQVQMVRLWLHSFILGIQNNMAHF